MLSLPLEPTDDLARPAFWDVDSCSTWLDQLQLTNIQPAHELLLKQLGEFNRSPMRGFERLQTLELLRETINYVQDNYARRLISKPLPLGNAEHEVFAAIVQLWKALGEGYQRCLQTYIAGDALLQSHVPLLCQRCLLYGGLAIFEHLRCGYEFDSRLWRQLHELYAFAESNGLQNVMVADPLSSNLPTSSCQGIYVKFLLACYARPAELTRIQLQLLDGWLSQWCTEVTVARSYSVSKGDAQPLALDFSSKHGLLPVQHVPHSDTTRYVAMVPMSKLLRVKTILLQQGQTPHQQKLGDGCTRNECIEFLTFLHQCWCEDMNTRFGTRKAVAHHMMLCHRLGNIYAHIAGQPLNQSGSPTMNLGASSGQLLPEDLYPTESWHLENESILGGRLTRDHLSPGRLGYNQLVALRPVEPTRNFVGSKDWVLAETSWVNVALTGHLRIGIRYFPGTVDAIQVTDDETQQNGGGLPAFILHAVPALKTPPSLIVQRGFFRTNRLVTIIHRNAEKQHVQLGFRVEQGSDYERVSYTQV
jgi:hypothetical protein